MLGFIFIMFGHWVSDFVLQFDWMAQNKSKNPWALLSHTLTYSLSMSFFVLCYLLYYDLPVGENLQDWFWITFGLHTLTDFVSSKISSYLYKEGKIRLFFIVIGFDQFLHFVQILLTWNLIHELTTV